MSIEEREDGAWPKTEEELVAYIRDQLAIKHDYSTSAEALWKVALAAFNYVAYTLGNTGFQAGWAALTFYGKSQGIKGPFGVLRGEHLIYPQYDLLNQAKEWIEKWTPWAAEEAQKKLDKGDSACDSVMDHWRMLATKAAPDPTLSAEGGRE